MTGSEILLGDREGKRKYSLTVRFFMVSKQTIEITSILVKVLTHLGMLGGI